MKESVLEMMLNKCSIFVLSENVQYLSVFFILPFKMFVKKKRKLLLTELLPTAIYAYMYVPNTAALPIQVQDKRH